MRKFYCWLLFFPVQVLLAQDATEIVRKADEKMRGSTTEMEMTIRTLRPGWSREMQVKAWSKGTAYTMILIQSPARDKGVAFLKRAREIWNWMPALERVIKLPPSMMSQSWMGTDFTNDDLVKESSVVNDYIHRLKSDTLIGDRSCYVIEMIPKPEAAVVWGSVTVCIDKNEYLELHVRFYDEDGELVNTMNASDIRRMDDRVIPTRFEMIPAGKKNQKTEMIYRTVRYNRPMSDGFFTPERMKTLE